MSEELMAPGALRNPSEWLRLRDEAGNVIGRARGFQEADGTLRWDMEPFAPDSLDAAWAEAEAALPDAPDWGGPMLYQFQHHAEIGPYGAKASPPGDDDDARAVYGYGPTPAAALRALAAKLRAAGGGR